MKALLIDNYDSFSYNLFHLWVSVTGQEPRVLRNDDWELWDSIDLRSIEAILVSPGPGRPERDDDIGISRAAIASPRTASIPLLGVCLGHQALCLAEGASIVPAPEPVHGRSSPITHDGTGLFHGLPSPFAAVRYHSLIATRIPPSLDVLAATAGPPGTPDIVMAVRHRSRPHWGVQFHPESIATEHGRDLMANFATLAAGHRAITVPRGPAEPPAHRPDLPSQTGSLRLLTRRLEGEPDCAALFTGLFGDQQHAYWLDSSAVIPGLSRFSILGGTGPLGEWVTAVPGTGQVRVEAASGGKTVTGDLFGYLGAELRARAITAPGLPFDFALGYVGFLGYELKADSGGDHAHDADEPSAAFLFSDRGVVVDHQTHETWILTLTSDTLTGEDHEAQAKAWLEQAAQAVATPAADRSDCPAPALEPLTLRYRHSPEHYARLVQECQSEIRQGESYEICLTNEITVDVAPDPLATFLELRRISPAPYAAFLRAGERSVLSASPERFLKISPDGHLQAKPIKGTRRRGIDPVDDAQLARDLGESAKDRAENLMIVDLLRNDLGVVATAGSVEVTRLFDVETFAAVHQLVSTVEAQLRPELDPIDCVRAAFPGGSMTGAPKRRTMQIIDRIEGGPRGVYSGALGYFSLSGAVDLSIVIRTLVVHPDRVTLGVGGAVIALSDPEAEVEEMLLKAQAPLEALRRAVRRSRVGTASP